MELDFLHHLSLLFQSYSTLSILRRIEDNLFKLQLDDSVFYLDLRKGKSQVFISAENLEGKSYQAPFDLMLAKLATRAKILSCTLDGNNRILIFHCSQQTGYKHLDFFLHFEFTGKHTNVILVDSHQYVLEALHHLSKNSRIIQTGVLLSPLPQRDFKPSFTPYDQNLLLERLRQNYTLILKSQLEEKRKSLSLLFHRRLEKLKDALFSLKSAAKLQEEAQILSHSATLLLSQLHQIKPYMREIKLIDFENKPVTIPIPLGCHNPQEAINKMFSQSKRLMQKSKGIDLEKQNLEEKIHFLTNEIAFIAHTQRFDHLLILKTQKKKTESSRTCEVLFIQNYKISIGRNQSENQLLLKNARSSDIWMHIRNIPSSHLIISCGKNHPPFEVIYKAGEILVGIYAKNGDFEVDYTQRKFVKVREKALVNYTRFQTLRLRTPSGNFTDWKSHLHQSEHSS